MYRKRAQGWVKHIDFIMLDVVCLHAALFLAHFVRFGIWNPYSSDKYSVLMIFCTLTDLTVLVYNDSCKNVLKRGWYREFAETIRHVFLVELLTILFLFSSKQGELYSRIEVYLMGFFYAVLSYAARMAWKSYLNRYNSPGQEKSFFLVTTAEGLDGLICTLKRLYGDKMRIVGICIPGQNDRPEGFGELGAMIRMDDVAGYLCRRWVDEVFVSLPEQSPQILKMLGQLTDMGLVVHVELSALFEMGENQKTFVERMGDKIVLTTSMRFVSTRQMLLKRLIDIVGGILGCIATILLTIIIGPIIYLKSPGPIFFAQTRIGKNGKKFVMYKFRSMYPDAEERKRELEKENRVKDGMMFKLDYDPRIIGCKRMPDGTIKRGIGNFIRDWSLDEFPQFFNVLTGTMSLCGTRPPTEDEWERYELNYRSRLSIKPGITGLWQVSGRSDITDFATVLELDKKYIREWSLGLDCRIILETVGVVLRRKGAR